MPGVLAGVYVLPFAGDWPADVLGGSSSEACLGAAVSSNCLQVVRIGGGWRHPWLFREQVAAGLVRSVKRCGCLMTEAERIDAAC